MVRSRNRHQNPSPGSQLTGRLWPAALPRLPLPAFVAFLQSLVINGLVSLMRPFCAVRLTLARLIVMMS